MPPSLIHFSHELRTPLSILDTGLKLLEKKISELSESIRPKGNMNSIETLIQEAKLSCNWSIRVMDDLMLFENIIGSSITISRKEVQLIPFLQQTAKMYIMHAAVMGIELQLLQSAESVEYDVYSLLIDEVKMGQAVGNLIYNAINFSPPKTVVRIAICHICEDGNVKANVHGDDKVIGVRIAVSDSGPGLTLSSRDKIFTDDVEFGNKVTVGSGLCLWISKKIAELHDGRIGVFSEGESRGSTFYLDVPIFLREREAVDSGYSVQNLGNSRQRILSGSGNSRASNSNISAFRRRSSAAVGVDNTSEYPVDHGTLVENRTFAKLMKQTSECLPKPRKLRILIVDDSVLIRKMMLRILCGMGHHCDVASDGREAVQIFSSRAEAFDVHDVILMEYVIILIL